MKTNTKQLSNALKLMTDRIEDTERVGDTFVVNHQSFTEPLVFSMEIVEAIGSTDYRVESNRFFKCNLYIACGDRNIFTWGAQDVKEDAQIYNVWEAVRRMDYRTAKDAQDRHMDNSKVILNRLIK